MPRAAGSLRWGALQGAPGAAVFASSVVARIGVANHEAIAAAKGGVEALVRSAAATYASQGMCVNAVAPGMTETPMAAGMLKMPAMREGAARQYPLGGVQTAEQVAEGMALAARRRRDPPDRPSDCGGRRLHHRAAVGEASVMQLRHR
jgi:NAD(P)-dependent dehydrogenase (short-subunit alcohol dehydrogenase family)